MQWISEWYVPISKVNCERYRVTSYPYSFCSLHTSVSAVQSTLEHGALQVVSAHQIVTEVRQQCFSSITRFTAAARILLVANSVQVWTKSFAHANHTWHCYSPWINFDHTIKEGVTFVNVLCSVVRPLSGSITNMAAASTSLSLHSTTLDTTVSKVSPALPHPFTLSSWLFSRWIVQSKLSFAIHMRYIFIFKRFLLCIFINNVCRVKVKGYPTLVLFVEGARKWFDRVAGLAFYFSSGFWIVGACRRILGRRWDDIKQQET